MSKKLTEIEAYKLEVLGLHAEKLKNEIKYESKCIECLSLNQALMQEKAKLMQIDASQRKQHQETLKKKIEDLSLQSEGVKSDIRDRLGLDENDPLGIDPDTLEVIDNDHKEVH